MTVSLEVLNRKNASLYILFPTLRGGFRSHTRIIMYKYVCCAHVLCLLSILIFANPFLFKAKRRVRGHCAGKPCLMKTVDFSGDFPHNIFNPFPACTRTCERRYCAAWLLPPLWQPYSACQVLQRGLCRTAYMGKDKHSGDSEAKEHCGVFKKSMHTSCVTKASCPSLNLSVIPAYLSDSTLNINSGALSLNKTEKQVATWRFAWCSSHYIIK